MSIPMSSLELAFSSSSLGQSENLKVLLAHAVYDNCSLENEVVENAASVIYKDSKKDFSLIEANSIVLYLASESAKKSLFGLNSSEREILIVLRKALVELSSNEALDKTKYTIENLPSFKDNEPVVQDPFQILVFSSLYPFYAAKFKFVSSYKWFSKFFKTREVYAMVKKLKTHTFSVISTLAKRENANKPKLKPKKESVSTRVIEAEKTGAQKLSAKGLEEIREKDPEAIVPRSDKKNILVTSALPYVNNVPHLGNVVGSVLSADVFARYVKYKKQYNVLFVGGTDEYGTATETKALEDKTTPRELCDKYYPIHRDVYKWFDIGFDYFGRTTTDLQTEISQDIFLKLQKNGFLSEHTIQQLYCEKHNGFLADRYVTGECPKCHDPKAKGDQCDTCGTLLNPLELINPKCKLDGHSPVVRSTDHVYLDLDKLEPKTKEWIAKQSVDGFWTKNTKLITESWLNDGLRPFAITRDLTWGTQVPLEKYKNKVLYVWFDATIGYISITANYFKNKGHTDDWKLWWKDPENVKLYQFMGKDNVSFHSIIFPASLIGTGEKWTKNHHIDTTEYLQYEGGKFSKSEKVGVFGDQAKDTGIPPSVWRYYLINLRPETSDSQFSWDDFVARNNSELLKNLGNFSNRLLKFININYKSVIPSADIKSIPKLVNNYDELVGDLNKILVKYNDAALHCKERDALTLAMSFSSKGNEFLQNNKLDNLTFNDEPEKCDAIIFVAINILSIVSRIIYPFMPAVTENLNHQLNLPAMYIPDEFEYVISGGHNVNDAQHLFSKIDEKQIKIWRERYGGVRTD